MAPNWRDEMTTDTTTRFAAFFAALAVTVAMNGSMLFMFDQVSKADQAETSVVALDTVTIVAKRV